MPRSASAATARTASNFCSQPIHRKRSASRHASAKKSRCNSGFGLEAAVDKTIHIDLPSHHGCGGEGKGEGVFDMSLMQPPPHPGPLPRFARERENAISWTRRSLIAGAALLPLGAWAGDNPEGQIGAIEKRAGGRLGVS